METRSQKKKVPVERQTGEHEGCKRQTTSSQSAAIKTYKDDTQGREEKVCVMDMPSEGNDSVIPH